MKTVSDTLKAHLAGELTTVAVCWRVTRRDGEQYFFTDHDVDLVIDGDTYEAASGMLPLALNQSDRLAVDNMDVVAFLDSNKVSEEDIIAGKFDYATVDIFLVDYNNLDARLGGSTSGNIGDVLDAEGVTGFFAVPEMVCLSEGYIAVTGYTSTGGGTGGEGYLRTYHVNVDGQITPIDYWALYNSEDYGNYSTLLKIPGSIGKYLLYYKATYPDAPVKSLSISDVGVITKSFIDSLLCPRLDYVSGQIRHTSNAGSICLSTGGRANMSSYTVDDEGNIGDVLLDSIEFSDLYVGDRGPPGAIVHIDGNYYVTVFRDGVDTFSVDASGNIAAIDSWEIEGEGNFTSRTTIIKVPNTSIYILVYRDPESVPYVGKGKIVTFLISDTGVITKNMIDTLQLIPDGIESHRINFTASICNILHVGGDYFAITAQGGFSVSNDGMVYTIACDSQGNLSDVVIDTLKFHVYDGADGPKCRSPYTIHVRDNIYAVAYYIDGEYSGYIKTFTIEAPTMDKLWLAKGWTLGNVEIRDNAFQAEIRGKAQHLDQQMIELISPSCRASLGDARCGVDLVDSAQTFWHDGAVTEVTSDRKKFVDDALPSYATEDVFTGGLLTWTEPGSGDSFTGGNAGHEMEIKRYDPVACEFELFQPMPNDIEVGDEYVVTWGCDKSIDHCKDRFDNVENFRGEPAVPGWDKIMHINRP